MSCERARELIIDALIEPLDAEQAAELNEHLATCEACAAESARYVGLWQQLGAAATPEPAADGLERLQARVDVEFGDTRRGANRGWVASLKKAAAVVVLVGLGAALAVGFGALRQPAAPEPVQGDR